MSWPFLAYIVRRIAKGVVVILGIVVLNFVLIRLAPGDPASIIAGQSGAGDATYVTQLREAFGLDRPILAQLWIYLRAIAAFDLGISYHQQRPVLEMIGERLGPTLLLSAVAFTIALVGGVLLGAVAAYRPSSLQDRLISVTALTFYATPLFWTGVLLILVFSVWLQWLPAVGMATLGAPQRGIAHIMDVARHLVLPGITLATSDTNYRPIRQLQLIKWNGKTWASLSVIAREMTGTRWSGPRFFGLKTGRTDG